MFLDTNETVRRPEMRIYIGLAIFLLLVGFLMGWHDPYRFSAQLTPSLKQLIRTMTETSGTGWFHTFLRIFFNNATTALELAVFGLVFGLFPAYSMWLNGLMSGYVVGLIGEEHHVSAWRTIVFGLLPHGIFELAAIFWAAALGIGNGLAVARAIRLSLRRDTPAMARDHPVPYRDAHPLRFALTRTARSIPIIWGMLLIAALIEAAITPHILAWGIPMLHHS